MSMLLSLYHRLPYPLKVVAASANGFRLRHWRYSPATERLVAEALERDAWSLTQWDAWRRRRLEELLYRARTRVPYYRELWAVRRRAGDRRSPDDLASWPVLPKTIVRDQPTAFIADDVKLGRLYVDHTSGTTGRPTLIYNSRQTVVRWYAIVEARLRRWFGVSHEQRWGMFGGQQVVALGRRRPPFWVHNRGLNQLYCSIFHINRDTAREYVAALRAFGATHLIVFPSALAVLAHHMIELGLTPPPLRVILCNSEKLLPDQRVAIERAFSCPVIETYGMAEMAAAGSECEHGTMHAWPEVGLTEIYDRTVGTVGQTGQGELALTSFANEDMPLIRYLNGDAGEVPRPVRCRCGRTLPELGAIEGRSNDLIATPDGRKLYLLDSLFNGLPIVEGQLIQETIDTFTAKLVPKAGFDHEAVRRDITAALSRYVGVDVAVALEVVPAIERNRNGKFTPYVSNLR